MMKKIKQASIGGLTIGYDGKRAVCNYTGIGNYSRYLVDVMSRVFPDNKYVLYSPKYKKNDRLEPLLLRDNVELKVPGRVGSAFASLWRSFEMTRCMVEDSVSVIHGLSNELPLNVAQADIASVVTIHDLIWRRVPQNYSAIDRKIYDYKYGKSARNATRIVAISECTKADIVNDFGVDPAKIDVIYQGCNPIFSQSRDPLIAAQIKQTYNLPETYILSVGTVEYRKNQLQAVKALKALPVEVKLVIVGGYHKGYYKEIHEYISRHSLSDRVIWLQGIPIEHLPYLYAMARVSSYTSRYEGFGLPVIESLTVGTPVIAATGSCLEEAGGKGAIYVSPDDVDAYIHAAKTLIEDNYYYHKYADAGVHHVKRFNDVEFARQMMATYNKAIIDKVNQL